MLRPELRLLAMSATADGARLSALMSAEIVESAGRMFPVTVQHATRDIAGPRDLPDAMARAVRAALAEHAGDILAFLPGMAEIRRAETALQGCGALVLPLHGELPPDAQDRALRPAETRRVVLATSIAETSLTVPGVRIVVDGGWRRAPRLDPSHRPDPADHAAHLARRRGATRRPRRARGSRRGDPPVVHGAAPRPASLRPPGDPGSRTVLAGAGLRRLGHAARRPAIPRQAARRRAGRRPRIAHRARRPGRDGRITAQGRRMALLGAHPRLAAMLLAAEAPAEAALAADLAALLEERDPLRSPDAPADIGLRIQAIASGDAAADRGALSRIRRAAAQYRRRLRLPADTSPDGDPGQLLAAASPTASPSGGASPASLPPVRRRRRQAAAHRPAGKRRPAGRSRRWR